MSEFQKYIIRYGCVVLRTDAENVRRREVYLYEGNHIERGTLKFEQIEKFADKSLIGSFDEAVKDDRIQIIGIPFTKETTEAEAKASEKEESKKEDAVEEAVVESEVDSKEEEVSEDESEKPTRRRKSSK